MNSPYPFYDSSVRAHGVIFSPYSSPVSDTDPRKSEIEIKILMKGSVGQEVEISVMLVNAKNFFS